MEPASLSSASPRGFRRWPNLDRIKEEEKKTDVRAGYCCSCVKDGVKVGRSVSLNSKLTRLACK